MTATTQKAKREAQAVLAGYCSTHPEKNARLCDAAQWQTKAKALLDAREFDILQALSPETLREIADGRLDMAEVYLRAHANNAKG